MKYVLIAALVTLAMAAACSSSSTEAVHITQARAAGSACLFNDPTIYKERGSFLDLHALAIGATDGYSQVFGWENTLQPTTTTVNGQIIQDPSSNTFYAHRAQLSYASSDSSLSLPSVTWDMSGSITAGASATNNSVLVELLPGTIPGKLLQAVAVGTTPVTLDVTFHIDGEVAGHKASTAPFTFPLTLARSPGSICVPHYYAPGECKVIGKDNGVGCSDPDAGVPGP